MTIVDTHACDAAAPSVLDFSYHLHPACRVDSVKSFYTELWDGRFVDYLLKVQFVMQY